MSGEVYPVPAAVKKKALIDDATYKTWYQQSVDDPEGFWSKHGQRIDWFKPYTKVKNTSFTGKVAIKWFEGGTQRLLQLPRPAPRDRAATRSRSSGKATIPNEDARSPTASCTRRSAARQRAEGRGVKKGDRVCIYLPMIPEAAVAMLACTRIGAIHSIVFGGFSPDSLRDRINDCRVPRHHLRPGMRGGKKVPLKKNADKASNARRSTTCIVVRRTGGDPVPGPTVATSGTTRPSRRPTDCEPEEMDAEDPLFILYTSGSTGKPKGVLHTTGGYLLRRDDPQYVFDYQDGEVYWCTADVGWVTGHTYIVYGPLANGAITLMFEGIPTYPDISRFWQVCDKHKVRSSTPRRPRSAR
jgi:acetyl-CoA synthetase